MSIHAAGVQSKVSSQLACTCLLVHGVARPHGPFTVKTGKVITVVNYRLNNPRFRIKPVLASESRISS